MCECWRVGPGGGGLVDTMYDDDYYCNHNNVIRLPLIHYFLHFFS
jgi:hypothetical protein